MFDRQFHPSQLKNIFKPNKKKHSLPICSPKSLTIYYTITPNTKPQACTMLRSIAMFALKLTGGMLHQNKHTAENTKFRLHIHTGTLLHPLPTMDLLNMNHYEDNCV